MTLGDGHCARPIFNEASVRARTDTDIFAIAPINEIVLRLRAGRGMIGNLIGWQAMAVP